MIKLNPRERLTIPQILAHHWLKETNEDDSDEEEEEKNGGGAGVHEGVHEGGDGANRGIQGVAGGGGA